MTDDPSRPMQVPVVPPQSRTRLASWFLAIAVVAVVSCVVVWAIRMAIDASNRKATRMNLAQVGLALRNYSETIGHLPFPVWRQRTDHSARDGLHVGTGRPLYSWRVKTIPYLISWHGPWDPLQPWDSPTNRVLAELSFLYDYADSTKSAAGGSKAFPETNVMAITGPGTAFGDGEEPPKALRDVSPHTILVVETRASGVPWPAPGDFDIRTMPRTINAPGGKGISSRHAGGFHVVFADGQLWFLSDKVAFETLEKFFTTAEAKKNDREKLLGPFVLHRGL